MGVRREAVRLELQDAGFSTGMARAAAATALLDRSLNDLDGSTVRTRDGLPQAARGVDALGASSRSAGPEIDRLSGRMRIMADAAITLGPSLVPISAVAVPALTGLASQLGFAAVGMTSLIAASQGVGDALKTVNEASLSPTTENLEKAHQAMAKLGPEAQNFVLGFQEFRPVLADIRDHAAAGWFPGLTESLGHFEQIGPRVATIFEKIGEVGGRLVAEGAESLAGPEWDEFLTFVEDNAPQALEELGRTAGNVTKGLAELWMAFDPLNDDVSGILLDGSRAFADWAEGLDQTAGFQEFVDYIRSNGPQVKETLLAIGGAVGELIGALAPLGGPSLAIIEGFANVISAIADSNLGTPILAGAAALAVYNRALQVTAALQTRVGITGAAASGGMAAGGLFGMGAGGNLRKAGGDLRTYAALRSQVMARTTAETAKMNAAAARSKDAFGGMAKNAAPAAAALTLVAAASTDTGQSLISTNTAMLTLLGSMGGPWGAVAGAAVGGWMDVKAAIDAANESIAAGDRLGANSQLNSRLGTYGLNSDHSFNPGKFAQGLVTGASTRQLAGDAYSHLTGGKSTTEKLADEGQAVAGGVSVAEYYARKAAADAVAAAESGLAGSLLESARAAGISSNAMAAGIEALTNRTNAALGAFDAETQWRNAMSAANQQAKESDAGIRGNSDAVLANRAALSGLAGAWNNQSDAVKNNVGRFREARQTFIDTAVAMGVPRAAARALAKQLLDLPKSKKIDLLADDQATGKIRGAIGALGGYKSKGVNLTANDQASGVIRGAVAALGGFQSKNITITTTHVTSFRRTGSGAGQSSSPNDTSFSGSSGGYTGGGDKYDIAGVVHRDEVVIPKELVRRDRDLLKSRYGHLPGMDQLYTGGLAGYAGGGRVGDPFPGLPNSLKALNRALKESEAALARETSQRDAVTEKIRSLASDVTGGLRSQLFGGDVWSDSDPFSVLRADIARTRTFNANRANLARDGLDGEALAEILRQDPTRVAEAAQWTRAQTQEFERLFKIRASMTTGAGNAAGLAAHGAERNREIRQLAAANHELRQIKAAIRQEHREDRRSNRRGAGNGSRNRRRG